MAFLTANQSNSSSTSALRNFFRAIGNGLSVYMERMSRQDEINRLQKKSDAELSKLGIRREQICYHVFRDMIHY